MPDPDRKTSTITALEGAIHRWKLYEPARLYCYGFGSILIAGLVLTGVLSGEWATWLGWAVGAALGLIGGAESTRASVYSQAGMIAAMRRLNSARDLETALTVDLGRPTRPVR